MDIATPKKKGGKKKKSAVDPKKKMKGRVGNAVRMQQRNLDRGHNKEVGPQRSAATTIEGAKCAETSMTNPAPPPAVIVVMGPRGVGKSTLIRSLVKLFTKQNLSNTTGPITVCCSTASKRRVTLIECPSDDLLAMVDLAKVADLALLLVDGSYGLQMETFEFLNLLQLHGFPKIAGVLTHLDNPRFRKNRTALQTVRKSVKQRLWTESHKGNKMFEFCGGVNGGKYKKTEVQRLALFVSRVKFRPLIWRNAHPYLLVDRIELVAQRGQNSKGDSQSSKEVTLFGYVRGSRLRGGGSVHLAGAGDFVLESDSVTALPDPCPLSSGSSQGIKNSVREKKKTASLHAPMADSGRVSVDREGGLSIELRTVNYTKKEMLPLINQADIGPESDTLGPNGQPTPVQLLRSMQDVSRGVDQQLKGAKGTLQLFAGDGEVDYNDSMSADDDGDGDGDDDSDDERTSEDGESNLNVEGSGNGEDDEENEVVEDEEQSDEESSDDNDDDEFNDDGDDNSSGGWSADEEVEEDFSKKEARLTLPTANATTKSSSRTDWMAEVYGTDWVNAPKKSSKNRTNFDNAENDDDDDLGGLFKLAGGNKLSKPALKEVDGVDSCRNFLTNQSNRESGQADILQLLQEWSIDEQSNETTHGEEDNDENSNDSSDDDADNDADVDEHDDGEESSSRDIVDMPLKNASKNLQLIHHLKLRYVTGGWLQSTLTAPEGTKDVLKTDESDDEEDATEKLNLKIDEDLRNLNANRKAAFKADFDLKYDKGKMGAEGKRRKKGDDVDGDDESHGEMVDSDEEGGRKQKKKGPRRGLTPEQIEQEAAEEEAMMKERAEAIRQQMAMVQERNRREFSEEGSNVRQQQLAGFGQGTYVRMLLKGVPAEFARHFRPETPLLVGGLLTHETISPDADVTGDGMGFLNARVKRHRWHKRVLKSNDPLIFSIGWRRFQAMPIYSIHDANQRQRFLKYTPEHMHCDASFFGPAVAPNTGIIAFQKISNSVAGFRIALSGTVLEHRASCEVVKKLKLVGTPLKVFKNTAFITGMFNSALEVAKFEHAKIKTVSGIRGSIKRALTHDAPAGSFRASFEDKILLSDLVICRLWVPVTPLKLFNPVLSLLAPVAKKSSNQKVEPIVNEGEDVDDALPLMRTTAQLRKDLQVPQEINKNSVYKPVHRNPRVFKQLIVPSKLQAALPFASKPKLQAPLNKKSYLQRRKVILEPEERQQRSVVQMLGAVKNQKVAIREEANKKRLQLKKVALEKQAAKFEDVHRNEKKRKYTDIGKEQLAREKKKGR